MRLKITVILACALFATPGAAETYDLVITNGRIMNPANGLDSIRHIGIKDGSIAVLSRHEIDGEEVVDASGLVVAPGSIDLHAHGQREFEARLQAQDGVTTQLEMELGAYPVAGWYARREGKAPINYGATVGHIGARIYTMLDMKALGIEGESLELNSEAMAITSQHREWMDGLATQEQIEEIKARIQEGLDEGALGVGYGINYTAGATREEILEQFRVAKANGVTNFVHSRFMTEYNNGGSVDADLLVFDPAAVSDRATFNDPALPSRGYRYVLVNGQFLVRDGAFLENSYPGRPVRR